MFFRETSRPSAAWWSLPKFKDAVEHPKFRRPPTPSSAGTPTPKPLDLQENKPNFRSTSRSCPFDVHSDEQRARKFRAVAEIGLDGRANGAARPGGRASSRFFLTNFVSRAENRGLEVRARRRFEGSSGVATLQVRAEPQLAVSAVPFAPKHAPM